MDTNIHRTTAFRSHLLTGALLILSLLITDYSVASPKIQHWTSNSGARVFFVESPELPMVDIELVFDAGSARDGGHPGLAQLTVGLLDDGAAGLDTDDIAQRFENIGASFSASSDYDMSTVHLRSLTDPELFEPALETMQLILSQPGFPEQSLARERKQMLTHLRAEKQSPSAIASKAFFKAVFADHPYAFPQTGTEESLTSINRQQLVDFYKRYYVVQNSLVAIVGAVTRKQAEEIAELLTKKLPVGDPATPLPRVADRDASEIIQIPFPSSQSSVLVGLPGIARGDPDYFPLYLGNFILGGSGLTSILSEEIREKRGLSYSTYSYFYPLQQRGPFIMGLQTRNDQVEQALAVLHNTLKDFLGEGIDQKQLETAKQNITGGFPLRIDSNKKIVEYLAVIGFYKLPIDYLDTFNSRIEAISVAQIRDAFKRRIKPEEMVTVVVGKLDDAAEPPRH